MKKETSQLQNNKKIDSVEYSLKQEITEVRGEIKVIDARKKNVETSVQKYLRLLKNLVN